MNDETYTVVLAHDSGGWPMRNSTYVWSGRGAGTQEAIDNAVSEAADVFCCDPEEVEPIFACYGEQTDLTSEVPQ